MNLYLFTFTHPDRLISSMRVAARSRASACAIMGAGLKMDFDPRPNAHPAPWTILQFLGRKVGTREGVISVIDVHGHEYIQ